ncbi:MAG: hypothetical protein PHX83_10845 [Acidobacteriia bacterium]|nr:hypothetical protein [Terriglobia bacterium]
MDINKAAGLGADSTWTLIGPNPTTPAVGPMGFESGRINSIAISPSNPQIILIGASTGGVWRSADGGASFAPMTDSQVDLAVGSIAFSPSNSSIVYAAMGDLVGGYLGSGVLKSTDAGLSWTRVSNSSLPAPGLSSRIAVDPTNPNNVYLAQFLEQVGGTNFSSGFFLSTDGGVNWSRTFIGLPTDLAISPADPHTLYLGMARVDQSGGLPAGVYKSADSGQTWTRVFTSPYDANQTFNLKVAVSPASPQSVFLYIGGNIGGNFDARFEVSTDGGALWINKGSTGLDTAQFAYNNYVAVDPQNPNTIYIGSRDVYKSIDGGLTWTNMTHDFTLAGSFTPQIALAHTDQHDLAFMPGQSSTLFIANDGGIWKSSNAGVTFQTLNTTLALTQVYRMTLHPTNSQIYYVGSQDNGGQARLDTSTQWKELATGDGGPIVVAHSDPSTVFLTLTRTVNRFKNNGTLFDATVGVLSTFGEPNTNPRVAFIPAFTGNSVDDTLYFGSWRLFTSTNLGNSWTTPSGSTDLTKGGNDALSTIAVAPGNKQVIYTGSLQGRVMVSNDGGFSWNDITSGLPNRSVTHITVDPNTPSTSYVTFSGFSTAHVFKTSNSGSAWTDISGNLPDIPTNALLIDPTNPNTLYVGTDIGIFRSTQGGGTWSSFNTGLPPVIVDAFTARPSGVLQAGTYGRSVFEITSGGGANIQDNLSVPALGASTVSTAGNPASSPVQAGYATVTVNSGNAPYGTAVFSFSQNGFIVSEAGVPTTPATTSARLFIDFRSNVPGKSNHEEAGTISVDTGVALVNPGLQTANVTYTLKGNNGNILGTPGSGTLPGGAHRAKFIDQLTDLAANFVLPSGFSTNTQFATLEISSSQPLVVLALRLTTNQRGDSLLTTTPVADLTKPPSSNPSDFPQLVDGSGFQTTLILLNTSNAMESGTINLFLDNGTPLNVHLTNGQQGFSFPYNIPSAGFLIIKTDGSSAGISAGSVQVVPSGGTTTPVGAGVFGLTSGGNLVTESGVPAAIPTTHARIYVDESNGNDTGLALAAPNGSPANIAVSAFQLDGSTGVGSSKGPIALVGNGHTARFVGQLISNLPPNFTGVLDISSASPFVAVTLRALTNARGDTILTTFPIADFNQSAPTPILFPQIADGGGFQTQFILISTTGAATTTVNFFGDNGSALAIGKSQR